jgi:predicted DNA-binding transcriptional regulator YafY
MDKVTKILLLANLLYHRRFVSLDEIMETCQISERTVYRYINTISAAHIPVYYDKDLCGYHLISDGSFNIGEIGTDDTILIAVAVRLLSERLNGLYRKEIEFLKQRLFSSQNFPIEELWDAFDLKTKTEIESKDLSDLVTNLIIHAAILNNRKLKISLTDETDSIQKVEIDKPSLSFRNEWHVSGKRPEGECTVPISSIKKASIG